VQAVIRDYPSELSGDRYRLFNGKLWYSAVEGAESDVYVREAC
jgi:hypothetical protein